MRTHVPFAGLWAMPIDVPYSFLLRDDALAWSCGQLPLDGASNVLAPGDLIAQTRITCDYICDILERGGFDSSTVGKLVLYHVDCTADLRREMLDVTRKRFGDGAVLVPVAVPHFYYDDLLIEVDVFASDQIGRWVESSSEDGRMSLKLVDAGELVWGQFQVSSNGRAPLERKPDAYYDDALAAFGLTAGQIVSEHWFIPGDVGRKFESGYAAAYLEAQGLFADPGSAVMVGDSDTRVVGELCFCRAAPSKTAVSEHQGGATVTSRRNGRFLWLSGRHQDGRLGLVEQTSHIMEALHEAMQVHDMEFANVVKSTTHYAGGSSPHELHDNMVVRNARYTKPGPASTGLPVRALASADAHTAIDLLLAVET
jgi:enamine deaminase RidA (YjgF/YER057c/UK114 family)